MDGIRYLDSGETMLVVEFGDVVDAALNERVLTLDEALAEADVPGIVETVPTFRSLAIHYEPLDLPREALIERVEAIAAGAGRSARTTRRWRVPVCFEQPHGEDLAEVAAKLNLSPERLVALACSTPLRVHMYGFAPGFAYLGGLPEEIQVARRPSPRPPHPANAVMIGGGMAAVASFPMPTGWWVIGRSAERLYAPTREPVFLVTAGDEIVLEPIDIGTFDALEARVAAGEIVAGGVMAGAEATR